MEWTKKCERRIRKSNQPFHHDPRLPARLPNRGVKKPTQHTHPFVGGPFVLVFNKLIPAHPHPQPCSQPNPHPPSPGAGPRRRLIFTSKWIRADYAFIHRRRRRRRRWITARKFSTKKSIHETVEEVWRRWRWLLAKAHSRNTAERQSRQQRCSSGCRAAAVDCSDCRCASAVVTTISWFCSRKFAKIINTNRSWLRA